MLTEDQPLFEVPADNTPRQGEEDGASRKGHSALPALSRTITPEDFQQSGTQKMVLERLDVAEARVAELEGCEERFHEADKERAILKERLSKETRYEILYSVSLVFGPLLVGAGFTMSSDASAGLLTIGGLVTLMAILAKLIPTKG